MTDDAPLGRTRRAPARDREGSVRDGENRGRCGAGADLPPVAARRCVSAAHDHCPGPDVEYHALVDDRERVLLRLSRGIATASQAVRFYRTSRIPTPPALPSREPAASRHSVGPAPRSVQTSPANMRRGSSALSFGCSQRADARSTHARKSLFANGEKPSRAYLAGRGGGGESGSPESTPLCERSAPDRYPSRGLDASGPTALHQFARLRVVGPHSPRAPLCMTNMPSAKCVTRSSSSQG